MVTPMRCQRSFSLPGIFVWVDQVQVTVPPNRLLTLQTPLNDDKLTILSFSLFLDSLYRIFV